MTEETTSLQKYLVDRGVASRRKAGDLIKDGHVSINHQVVLAPWAPAPGERDVVEIKGKVLAASAERKRTILLNKPAGYICSLSERDGRTIMELLPGVRERLVPAGRLDRESEGALLLSNDGDLIYRITTPRFGCRKTYEVTVAGTVTDAQLVKLRSRMVIDGYRIQPADVQRIVGRPVTPGREVLRFVLTEGRNRQIRWMCENTNLKVLRLFRTAIRGLTLGSLKSGQYRELTKAEVDSLRGQERPVMPVKSGSAAESNRCPTLSVD